jgi:hypothetical protein
VIGIGGDPRQRGLADTEVLRQDRERGVLEPVGEQECLVLGERAVVEDQEELAAVGERLDRVRETRPEIPQITDSEIVDEVVAVRVDGGDTGMAGCLNGTLIIETDLLFP